MNARPPIALLTAAILCGAVLLAGQGRAAESSPGQAGAPASLSPTRFRRVYAPLEAIQELARDRVRYVPMDKNEFERLIGEGETPNSAGGSVASAEYVARLSGDALVGGEAFLNLRVAPDRSSLVSLEPCGLAIEEAVWSGELRQPARLGLTTDGRRAVFAESSRQLLLRWSLRGKRDPGGILEFALELPSATATRVTLDLPANLKPLVDQGVVVALGKSDETAARWRVELGGQPRAKLRLVPAEDLDPQRQLNAVRQTITYDFSLRGVEVAVQLVLDVPSAPVRQVTLELDPELQIVTAHYGDSPVPWAAMSPRPGSRGNRVVLDLPEPIQGASRMLRLTAVAPIELNRRWRLPTLQTDELFWQEGTATLLVPAALAIDQMAINQGRSLGVSPLPGARAGESVDVQFYTPEGSIEILLSQPQTPFQIDSGTSLELSGVELTGRVVANVRIAEGEQFQIEADVGRNWAIHSVETVPAGLLDDWTVQNENEDRVRLAIRLAKAVAPTRPARLVVAGRYVHSPLGRILLADDLTPIRFHASPGGKRLVSLRVAESCQTRLIGGERLTRPDPQALTAADLELFAEPPRGLLFSADAAATALQVAVEQQRPTYSATIRVEATATSDGLVESYHFKCSPEAGRIDRVLVRFSPARSAPLKWALGSEGEEPIIARPWQPSTASSGGVSQQNQTWEIALRRPRSVAFELHATRVAPWSDSLSVSLASMPEASSQRGTLLVGTLLPGDVTITNRRLSTIPAEPVPDDQYSTTRAAFRFDPVQETATLPDPAVELSQSGAPGQASSAWIWSVQLESRFEAGGAARHLATYRIQNSGRQQIQMILPPSLPQENVLGVWVDDTRVAWESGTADEPNHFRVPLPPGRKFPVVSVHFATRQAPFRPLDAVEPVMPETDLPVLNRVWNLWLPPGYQGAADEPVTGQWKNRPLTAIRERLLGPLSRPRGQNPFDPLKASDWSQLAHLEPARAQAAEKAAALLEWLGSTAADVASGDAGVSTTAPGAKSAAALWSERLARAASELELTLLVDHPAMSRLRLTSRSPLSIPAGDSSRQRGIAMLERANLMLLFRGDTALLTSTLEAALHRSQLSPMQEDVAAYVLPGPLAEQLTEAIATSRDRRFLPIDAWSQMPREPRSPWSVAESSAYGPSDALGWTLYHREISSGETERFRLFNQATIQTLGWASFIAVFGLGVWKGRRRPATMTAIGGMACVASLLVPAIFVPVASGIFLASLATLLAGLLGQRKRSIAAMSASKVNSSAATALAVPTTPAILLLIAAYALLCRQSFAEDSGTGPLPEQAKIHNVVIPVDGNEKPAGDKYLVPEALYQQLQQRAAQESKHPLNWQIRAASYRGALNWQTAPEELLMGDLKASFELQVFGRNVEVRVPLAHEGVRLATGGALLDGRPIAVEWPEGSPQLAFRVEDPGPYRLDLTLLPVVQSTGGACAFELKIPRVNTARLELAIPRDSPAVEVPSALGVTTREGEPSRVVSQLGPSDRLRVRWPQGVGRGPGPTLDVEQLLWIKIQPGSVVLETQLRFEVVEGRARYFELAVDSRLQRLPSGGEHSLVTQVKETGGSPQVLRYELSRPVSDPFTLQASFMLTKSSGIGNLRLPHFDVLNARTKKRWLAVSIDPELTHTQQGAEQLQAVAAPAFASAWGGAKMIPAFAYSIASPRPNWSIAVRPVPPRTAVEQTLAVSLDANQAQLWLEASLQTSAGTTFEYRIAAPPDLDVERVSLQADGVERVGRWSRGPDGSICVFLNGPATGKQDLSLRGRLPVRQPAFQTPLVRIEGCDVKSSMIHVYREPAVRVQVAKKAGLTEIDPPAAPDTKASLGRLVKAFKIAGADPVELGLALSPNQPRIRAEQVTLLQTNGETWEATVDYRIEVAGGLVDEFRLDGPAGWTGPYKSDAAATIRSAETASGGRRQISIRPASEVEGKYRLKVSAPITFAAGERTGVPRIALDRAEIVRHVLVLPLQRQVEPLVWETRGVVPTPLPEEIAAMPAARGSLVAYQAVQESFQVRLHSAERASGVAQVLLADIALAWKADRTCYGLASYDLDPADLTACTLQIPDGYRVAQVIVAGIPSTLQKTGDRQWQVPLGPNRLPQRIEVLFAGQLPDAESAGSKTLLAPSLVNLPVRQTVWSISNPAPFEVANSDGYEILDRLQHEMLRLRTITTVLELANDFPLDEPEQANRWYRAWAKRWAAARDEVKRELALAEGTNDASSVQAELETLERRQAVMFEHLGPVEARSSASEAIIFSDPIEVWLLALDRPQTVTRCVGVEGPSSIHLRYRNPEEEAAPFRMAGVLVLSLLVVAVVAATRRGLFHEWFRRWPHAIGVIAGLAWWLWLTPSILGWAIVLVSLVSAFRPNWPRTRLPNSAILKVHRR